jgi:emp24/gp25L/p24 family/GOLD
MFHLPRLSLGARPGSLASRRIIFDIRTGFDARAPDRYKKLAKEQHLAESDKLFVAVHGHVSEIVRRVDEMRSAADQMSLINESTSRTVNLFSIAACIVIVGGAVYVSYATQITLRRQKLI